MPKQNKFPLDKLKKCQAKKVPKTMLQVIINKQKEAARKASLFLFILKEKF
jgi:hypothetical protein